MGDCPEQYLEFNDHTDEVRAEFARLHDTSKDSMRSPQELKELEEERLKYPAINTLETLEAFAVHQGGYRLDPKTGKVGYWSNPNAKWDWYVIGGRWSGFLPCLPSFSGGTAKGRPGVMGTHYEDKPNAVDVARIGWLDWATINTESAKELEEAFSDFDRMRQDERWFVRPQDEPGYEALTTEQKQQMMHKRWKEGDQRGTFMKLGELRALPLEEAEALKAADPERWIIRPWPPRDGEPRRAYAWSMINHAAFADKYHCYFNRLCTYAFLDKNGWIEPGEMNMLAMSSTSADSYAAYCKAFDSWIRDGDSQDWLVVVDCHI